MKQQPDWDLKAYFSGVGAPDFEAFVAALREDVVAVIDRVQGLPSIASATVDAWAAALCQAEDISARFEHVRSYLGCVNAADATDELAQRQEAALAKLGAELHKATVAIQAAFKVADSAVFAELLAEDSLGDVAYYVTRLRDRSARTMAVELENLTADLAVDGIDAWGRLYDKVSGNLTFELSVPGREPERLPVAMTRTLLEDSDGDVRTAALQGASAAWETVGDTVASCLNAISGTRLSVYARRGIEHFLDPALFDAGIERRTLDVMLGVVRERQEVARRYLRAKAAIVGKPKLGFQDLMAPMPVGESSRIAWQDGTRAVCEAFAATYPALGAFAERALASRWVDYSARAGKRPGGFCTSSPVIGESRIFMTYNGAVGDVQTLAHELGHAFHSWVMRDQRWWACSYPMTLAETASTFAEQVVTDAALTGDSLADSARVAIIDTRLQQASAFLLNIPVRFDFESEVYTRRADGELTVSQLKELMVAAQRKHYGDALAEDQLAPWFWASKLHFYITDISFYNFPYTFGYLFSLGIFARAKREGAAFFPQYEKLLRATGSASAEVVARDSLGIDLQQPAFWNESIDLIAEDLREFERLLPRVT